MDLESQIRLESSQAARLSQEANRAFAAKGINEASGGSRTKMSKLNPAVQLK